MKKLWTEFINFASHNTGFVIAQVLAIVAVLWIYGCESQVQSIVDPAKKVTRAELNIEVDTLLSIADIRYAQLDKQDELKKNVLDHALLWTQAGTINPVGLITALAALTGIGATVDNVTKRRREHKICKNLAEKSATSTD